MKQRPGRRSFLAMTGTSASAALAGCSDLNGQSQTEGDEEATPEGETTDGAETDGEATLTVQIRPDQEELTSVQEELQTELENGNITQTKAQNEFQRKQEELTTDAATTYEETVADADAVSIANAAPEAGLLRLTAPAATFVNGLEDGDLAAILPSEYFDQYLQQQQIQEAIDQEADQGNNTTSN